MQQQQFAQQAPMFMQPQQPQSRVFLTSDPEAKLHISKLHDSITEEILWTQFKDYGKINTIRVLRDKDTLKSRRVAKIFFATKEAAKEAKKDKNMTLLIPQEFAKNSKRILVQTDKDQDVLKQTQKHNLFITGLPQIKEEPKTIYSFFTQHGEIQSLSITYKKDGETLAGHGCILFENKKDADTFLKGEHTYGDSKLVVQPYQQERKTALPNFYVKDFLKEPFTSKEIEDKEQLNALLEKHKQIITEIFAKYGEIQSVILSFNVDNKAPYAFVSFKDSEAEEKVQEAIENRELIKCFANENVHIKLTKSTSKKVNKTSDRFLHIKNLKCYEDEEEQKQFQAKCVEILEKYGKVKRLVLNKGIKPKEGLENSCFTIAEFEKEADAKKFLYNYLNDSNVNQIFLKENPHGNVTISMSKADRSRMVRSTQTYKQNLKNFQQQALLQQQAAQYNQQNTLIPRGQQNQQRGGQYQKPFSHSSNYRGGQNQQRGGPGFNQQQPGRNYSAGNRPAQRNFNQQQQQPRPQGQQPRPISQDQPAQQAQASVAGKEISNISLEDLKQNLDQFTKLEATKQSQVLGNLIYPKVKEIVLQQNELEAIAPKITGMLIDFSVFEVTDILDILESQDELNDRVVEAIELIKQQAQ